MTKYIVATIVLTFCLYGASDPDPLSAREAAIKLIGDKGLEEAREVIQQMLSENPPISSPYQLSYLAELMKLTGDPRASETYRNAIGKGSEDPAIELLSGEYSRNFRGPMQPIVGEAEQHFFQAARKLTCIDKDGKLQSLANVRNQLQRSIVALYERDGFPLYSWTARQTACTARKPGVSLFLSIGVRGGEGMTDLDVDSDIRSLTAAAAYSQSLRSGQGSLSTDLLRRFLRTVTPFENLNRFRARYKAAHVDLFFNDRHAGDAAITYPDLRDRTPLSNDDRVVYNALKLTEFGVSAGSSFHPLPSIDADVAVTYRRIRRTGLIDDEPDGVENINQVELKSAISRFVGPDKVYGEFSFVNQSISPETSSSQSRFRRIYAETFRYQIYRLGSAGYGRIFQGTRGVELYGGAMQDQEDFGYAQPALVNQHDYFVGATVHGLHRLFDLSIQPTWYTFTVPADSSRNNRQYRTAAYGLVRLVDEERAGPNLPPEWHGWYLGFVHLIVPIQSDEVQQGLSAFADKKAGVELAAKWFTTARGGTSFLGSARYDVQRFSTLDRTFSLFTLSVSMGF